MGTSFNNSSDDVVVVAGVRTPFSKFGGKLRAVPSTELGAHVVRGAVESAGLLAEDIDDVFLGVTITAEVAVDGFTPARVAMLSAGLPDTTRSLAIDRACCSALTAIHLGASSIKSGSASFAVCGGMDNMSRAALLVPSEVRWGTGIGTVTIKDPLYALQPAPDVAPVAVDAGDVAVEYGIGREEQDEWAYQSHQKYLAAQEDGFFRHEILPYPLLGVQSEEEYFEVDEGPRADTTIEKLSKLPTVFESPTITAGNSPGLDAGAAAVVLSRRDEAEARGLPILATLSATYSMACEPRQIASAPGRAVKAVTEKASWDSKEVDVFEINEAFAAVPLVSARLLEKETNESEESILSRTNPNGGAVAIGHPTGASGARLVATAAYELARRGGGRAVAAICGGLGQADSIALTVT